MPWATRLKYLGLAAPQARLVRAIITEDFERLGYEDASCVVAGRQDVAVAVELDKAGTRYPGHDLAALV